VNDILNELKLLLGPGATLAEIQVLVLQNNTAKYPISTAYHDGEWWVNIEIQRRGEALIDIETHHRNLTKALQKALAYAKPKQP